MKNSSKWHYPRTDLAQTYLNQLEAGLNSIAIFAERRKGKTEFLIEDLTVMAKEQGLRTVYVNFWERKSDPVYCITQGVRRAIETSSPQLMKKWKSEISLKLGVIQTKTTIDAVKYPEIANEALDIIVSKKGGVLLMFDEIQHLATDPSFEELIATLRTFLDTNKRKVRAVFTGSSQDRLNKIFRKQKAAFYKSASLVDFPDMDKNFIDFLVDNFTHLTKRKLIKKDAYRIFKNYNYSPFIIVDLLQMMMREGIYNLDKGLDLYLLINNPDDEWRDIWDSLKLIDQIILAEVIADKKPLYQAKTYEFLANKIGLNRVTRGMLQSSVKRLRELGILNNESHGQWVFESRSFEEFIKNI